MLFSSAPLSPNISKGFFNIIITVFFLDFVLNQILKMRVIQVAREVEAPLDQYRDPDGVKYSRHFHDAQRHNRTRFRMCLASQRMLQYCGLSHGGNFYESMIIAIGGYRLTSALKRMVVSESRKVLRNVDNVDRYHLFNQHGKRLLWRFGTIIYRLDRFGIDAMVGLLPSGHVSIKYFFSSFIS